MLAETFKSLVLRYGDSHDAAKLWEELEKAYSKSNRHYHTLEHLDYLLSQILEIKDQIHDFDAVLFALYYHDVVYNVMNKDNEEKSAALATARLSSINVPKARIESCLQHIVATKAHIYSADHDTNLFTDADLSILGQDWESYLNYCQKVRKEYSIYPDLLYKPGRRKVLEHFLQMKKIFKTEVFFNRFEQNARQNIGREIRELL